MWQKTGKITLATATPGLTTLQTTWMSVHAAENRKVIAKESVMGGVGDEESVYELGVFGGAQTSAGSLNAKDNMYTKMPVLAKFPMTTATKLQTEASKGSEVVITQESETMSKMNSNRGTDSEHNKPAPTEAVEMFNASISTEKMPTDSLMQTKEPVVLGGATTKPSLRTYDPTSIPDALINGAAEIRGPIFFNQGSNPFILVILAGFCCIFMLLWGRNRRYSTTSSLGAPEDANAKGPKAQYMKIPEEQPFGRSQSDDDEFCDDFEEGDFVNDRDEWDDWEGNSVQSRVPQLNPFISALNFSSPIPLQQEVICHAPTKLAQALTSTSQEHIATAEKRQFVCSSVESTGSTDSLKVPVSDGPNSDCVEAIKMEKEVESTGDLFSQFGMIPTFKKRTVTSAMLADANVSPAFQLEMKVTPCPASSLPMATESSALFTVAIDDDLDAEDEWGEDDEWVNSS